jgi:hypothetical protein
VPPFKPLVGHRFRRLVVLARGETVNRRTRWLCRCDCGTEIVIRQDHLGNPRYHSCGCFHREAASGQNATHRMTGSREYSSWSHAKGRCFNPREKGYDRYGGRGITMWVEWVKNFAAFFAYIGFCPPGCSLDRYPNGAGNYEPGNVRWATPLEQNLNRSVAINFRTIDNDLVSLNHVAYTLGLYQHQLKRLFIKSGVLHG